MIKIILMPEAKFRSLSPKFSKMETDLQSKITALCHRQPESSDYIFQNLKLAALNN